MELLSVVDLKKAFGGLQAVHNLTFSIRENIIEAIIGPNGAGKTTLINLITGFLHPDEGAILFKGLPLTGLKTHQIVSMGISRTFQMVDIFGKMTVLENIMVGCHSRYSSNLFASGLLLPKSMKEERQFKQRAMELIHLVGLEGSAHAEANSLAYGDQKLVTLAKALASSPALLLLDEPSAGLNETETERFGNMLKTIKTKGIGLIIVEHDMNLVMDTADEILVLNYGRKLAQGAPEDIQKNKEVIDAYLGDELDAPFS